MPLSAQSAVTGAVDAHTAVVTYLADSSSPVGPDFGKASPVGLLVILLLLIVVLFLGWSVNKRVKRFNQRRLIADEMGIDVFDTAALDAEIARRGLDNSSRLRRTGHVQDIAHSAEARQAGRGSRPVVEASEKEGGRSDDRPSNQTSSGNDDHRDHRGDSEATKG